MRIREFGAFTWTPRGCQHWSPTRPSNPGLKSSTPLKENEGVPGSRGLESGPLGSDFEFFPGQGRGVNLRIRECQWAAKLFEADPERIQTAPPA
jgi:hypothetical protein